MITEVEELDDPVVETRSRPFRWLVSIFIKPHRALREITSLDRSVWLLPMLLLTVLTLASVFVSGPLRQQAAIQNAAELPPHFQYMTPEQQQQYMTAQESMNGPAMIYLFPSVGAVFGLWLGWVLLAAVLHLGLTLLGSRSTNTAIYNLAAWASLPLAVRLIVQIVALLATQQLITSPGLSGFVAKDTDNLLLFARSMLTGVDIYLFWQVALLLIGVYVASGLTRGKALGGVLGSVLLLLVLSALPGFLASQFGGLNVSRPFIFF
jgi:hypothetical protein